MEEGEYYLLFFFGGISLSSFSVFFVSYKSNDQCNEHNNAVIK